MLKFEMTGSVITKICVLFSLAHTDIKMVTNISTFNQFVDGRKIHYKTMDKSLCHRGHQYRLGPNYSTQDFNPSAYTGGGFYICDLSDIHQWFFLPENPLWSVPCFCVPVCDKK